MEIEKKLGIFLIEIFSFYIEYINNKEKKKNKYIEENMFIKYENLFDIIEEYNYQIEEDINIFAFYEKIIKKNGEFFLDLNEIKDKEYLISLILEKY